MAMIGANPEELDSLGHLMTQSADRLAGIHGELSSVLSMTTWSGSDAESFQGEWHGNLAGLLADVSHSVLAVGQKIHFEAAQQRLASGVEMGAIQSVPRGVAGVGREAAHIESTVRQRVEHLSSRWGWIAGPAIGRLPRVGRWASSLFSLDSGYRFIQNISKHRYQDAFDEGSGMISGALMDAAVKTRIPVFAVASLDVTLFTDVEHAARQVDWRPHALASVIPALFSQQALDIFGKATKQAVVEVGVQEGEQVVSSVISNVGAK